MWRRKEGRGGGERKGRGRRGKEEEKERGRGERERKERRERDYILLVLARKTIMVSCDSLTKKVGQHAESTDTEPTEGCCSRNVPIEFVDH